MKFAEAQAAARLRRRGSRLYSGFTLVELLVVIGIIVLLVGILLPVVNGVRKSAYAAASAQQINRLMSAIENYNSDYRAYPGPLSNDQVILQTDLPDKIVGKVTMSENLVLGLLGGLKLPASASVGGKPEYDETRIASRLGPMSLNPLNPKGGRSYIEVSGSELSKAGINFNDLPNWQTRGTGLYWETFEKPATNPKTGQTVAATAGDSSTTSTCRCARRTSGSSTT